MSDEDAQAADDAATAEHDAVDPRIAELEEENAQLRAQIADLEADPYRAPESSGQLGDVTPMLTFFEEQSFRAEVQAWERDTGQTYDVAEPGGVEV